MVSLIIMKSKRLLLIFLPVLFVFLTLVALKQNQSKLYQIGCCREIDFSGEVKTDEKSGEFEGKIVEVPSDVLALDTPSSRRVLGAKSGDKRIEVSLSEQKLRAWEGDTLFLETPVSTGLKWWPTPKGEFRIWIKLRATKMEGGSGRYYYNLPNVPYVMFFENEQIPRWKGYGIHGAYWHNDFGTPRSHGCVNLPVDIARKLYYWAEPVLPEGKNSILANDENPGTRIIIY
jgi:hypothetical protein